MRIICGTHKGRHIHIPKGFELRPTTEVAKEALFNILNNKIGDYSPLRVLDLYAGVGSLAFEFASRGAMEVVAVDINPKYTSFIKKNAEKLLMNNIRTITSSSYSFLKKNKKPFDLIFADPPYDIKAIDELPQWVFNNNNLCANAMLIIEHTKGINFQLPEKIFEQRNYGRVNYSFFR